MRKKKPTTACSGREITKEEYEAYDGLCQECYELEIAELDMDLEED